MSPEVMEGIRVMVRELRIEDWSRHIATVANVVDYPDNGLTRAVLETDNEESTSDSDHSE